MKRWLIVFLLTGSTLLWAQGHGGRQGGSSGGSGMGSGGMGSGQGMGSGSGNMGSGNMGPGMNSAHPMDPDSMPMQQRPMTQKEMNRGSFQMLQQMTGMNGEQLQHMYTHSGAQDMKQFASAVVASHNLHLDTPQVMKGLKTMSLTKTLKSMGVPGPDAKAEVKKAEQQVKQADKDKDKKKS